MIYFTADHHFNHSKIIKYTDRPWAHDSDCPVESEDSNRCECGATDKMNRDMVTAWNSVVSKGDKVYHLGDFTLGGKSLAREFFAQLNGVVSVVPAKKGHDQGWYKKGPYWTRHDEVEILEGLTAVTFNGHTYTLCHYPMKSWERSHYGQTQLHGHTHGTIGVVNKSYDIQLPPGQTVGIQIDVGVDNWGFAPIALDAIEELIRRETGT